MSQPTIQPKCLFFDVFGTCVDWRTSVEEALESATKEALQANASQISEDVKSKATSVTSKDWATFAQEWRNSYLAFTREIAKDPSKAWKTVDQHHLEALKRLLSEQRLVQLSNPDDPSGDIVPEASLFTAAQLQDLNLVWHRLKPWPDTCAGLAELNKKFRTVTLTNGNLSLIRNMVKNGNMPFTDVFSAEMFESYKPSPKVYLGAAAKVGLKPEECALVAAHLDDLKAAKSNGFGTVYIERHMEERWPELKEEGIPDIWIKENEEGFLEAAKQLGV